ncbi:hypothetical protein PoB_007212700 [Plakobranchus ocellatus]|uniref:Uncharacterized protein n=1 Tax=Plakobranchus ocellatus TaxID=259542 RepID=A0AAV4DNF1_9GAST|nr:hypothetical protein PoB_007212700 [Plakobranchus ocellatus]
MKWISQHRIRGIQRCRVDGWTWISQHRIRGIQRCRVEGGRGQVSIEYEESNDVELRVDVDKLSGPPSGQGAGSGARTHDRRVPADLRADSQATVLPTPPAMENKVICPANDEDDDEEQEEEEDKDDDDDDDYNDDDNDDEKENDDNDMMMM